MSQQQQQVSTYSELNDDCIAEVSKEHIQNYTLIQNMGTAIIKSVEQLVSIVRTVDYLLHTFPEVLYLSVFHYRFPRTWVSDNFNEHQWVYQELCEFLAFLDAGACAIDIAASKGRLDWIQFVRTFCAGVYKYSSWTYIRAVKSGKLELVQWIINDGCPVYTDVVDEASENKWIWTTSFVEHVLDRSKTWSLPVRDSDMLKDKDVDYCIAYYAAKYGHLSILKAYSSPLSIDKELLCVAAAYNHRKICKYVAVCLKEKGEEDVYVNVCSLVLRNGLKPRQGVKLDAYEFMEAASGGNLDLAKHILQDLEESEWAECLELIDMIVLCIISSCPHDNVDLFTWLYEEQLYTFEDVSVRVRVCKQAALLGKLNTLKWLHGIGLPLDERVLICAAAEGHTEVVKYLFENDCPGQSEVMLVAVMRGHLQLLDWGKHKGLEIDSSLMLNAAEEHRPESIRWLYLNGVKWHEYLVGVLVELGDLETIMWVVSKGCPWNMKVCLRNARLLGNYAIADWILEQREHVITQISQTISHLFEEQN